MDLITDVLNTSGLRKRILHQRSFYAAQALTFPCPLSMGFHVITQGEAYLWIEQSEVPIGLKKGDIAFMARGATHHLSTSADPSFLKQATSADDFIPVVNAAQTPLLTLVSGAYQLWHDPLHPFFRELPQWWVLRSEHVAYSDSLQHCLHVLSAELKLSDCASEAVIHSLLDVLFHLVLRRILSEPSSGTWGKANQDPLIGKVLQLMHSQPENDWSVAELAQAVGLSRSGFSAKFKENLGDTPLHYLTTLRMSKAMTLLANTSDTLEKIAHCVGYRDAFGFSKSFKKYVGLSPREFRKKDESEKHSEMRFSS